MGASTCSSSAASILPGTPQPFSGTVGIRASAGTACQPHPTLGLFCSFQNDLNWVLEWKYDALYAAEIGSIPDILYGSVAFLKDGIGTVSPIPSSQYR